MFSIAPHFNSICFGKCCPPFNYIAGPKGRNNILQNRTFYFGQPPYFHFFWVMGQSNWLVAREKKLIGEVCSEYMWNSSYFSLIRQVSHQIKVGYLGRGPRLPYAHSIGFYLPRFDLVTSCYHKVSITFILESSPPPLHIAIFVADSKCSESLIKNGPIRHR